MTTLNLGQYAQLKPDAMTFKSERDGLVVGFYKVIPDPPITCDVIRDIIEEEAQEKRDGNYVERVRVLPCPQDEATVVLLKSRITKSFVAADFLTNSDKPCPYNQAQLDGIRDAHQRRIDELDAQGDNKYYYTHKIKKTFVVA